MYCNDQQIINVFFEKSNIYSWHEGFQNSGCMNTQWRYYVIRLCDGKNREKGLTGMVHLPRGDVRKARIRAKFPRWGN